MLTSHQFMMELSAWHRCVFLLLDNNLIKYPWLFTKLGMCFDILKIWFGIANGKILSIFDSYLPATHPYFCFQTISKYQWIFTNLGMCTWYVHRYCRDLVLDC